MTIGEVADTPAKRVAEYKKRRKPYLERTFRPDENEYAQAQGWELVRENKASFRYRKLREFDEQLENEFWRLLYEFGYPTLNIGRSFQIVVADKQDGTVTKQIDVFGHDDETVIIGECKACEKRTKRSASKRHWRISIFSKVNCCSSTEAFWR